MDAALVFHPSEIICIEHEDTRLYAEVIQLSETRPVCWLRPLFLTTAAADDVAFAPANRSSTAEQAGIPLIQQITDLRQGSDLLLPVSLMRHALDVELIPLWSALHTAKPNPEGDRPVQNPLHSFTQKLWKAYPALFDT